MGNEQPRKVSRVTKIQIQVATMKSKYHLQIMLGRKNAQIIKAEKELATKIRAQSRNKAEEILIAERIINALKYAQACNYLMSYCASLKSQANFIAENIYNPEKLKPFLGMIYSLIYAAQTMGLSSLKEFRDLMRALNDPSIVNSYVDRQIMDLLSPHPSSAQINQYFIEMSERNQIPLEEINIIGHKFSTNINQQQPHNQPTFSQLQKMIADQLSKKMIHNPGSNGGNGEIGGNRGNNGQNGQGWNGGNNGGNNGQNGQGWNGGNNGGNNGLNGQGWNGGNNGGNNGQNGQGWSGNNYDPNGQGGLGGNGGFGGQGQGGYGVHDGFNGQGGNYNPTNTKNNEFVTPGMTPKPVDLGPNIYNPGKVEPAKELPSPYYNQTESKMSIKDINDIVYYPEVMPQPKYKMDPDFNTLCERIKVGL